MTSPVWALQQAIHAALSADATLIAALGGPRIHDDVPQGTPYPYVAFGTWTERNADTATESGSEIDVVIHAWSRGAGRRQVHTLVEIVRVALHDATLSLTGHRLVNLRHVSSEARRIADGDTYQGTVRLRAVTEPTP